MGTVTCMLGTINSGANVVISIVITPTAAGMLTNTASVTSAVNDPVAANNMATAATTVNPAGIPDFTITIAPTTINIIPGQTATATITLTPINGFVGTVNLSCAGSSLLRACTLGSFAVMIGPGNGSTVLTVTTLGPQGMAPPSLPAPFGNGPLLAALLALPLFALAGLMLWPQPSGALALRRRQLACAVCLALVIAGFAVFNVACGSPAPVLPPGTYTVTVTATSGALSHSVTLTVNVQ